LYEVIKSCVKAEEFDKIESYHRKLSEIVGKPVGLVKIKSKASKKNMKESFDSLYDVQQEYILSILETDYQTEFSPKLKLARKNSG
jgi:ribosomal protein L23